MCTIHTYSAKFYGRHEREIHRQLIQDSVSNDDGISLVFLDGHNEKTNTIYRTMDVDNAIAILTMLMHEATKYARVFIHLRAATTQNVGVGYTHAFDDMNGVIYMHNGVISNPKAYSVDSFQMVNWASTEDGGLLKQLQARRESFANVFRIDTVKYRWTMTRMDGSSLHTDGDDNYSSRSYGPLTTAVPQRTYASHSLSFIEKPKYSYTGNYYAGKGWSGTSGGYGGTYGGGTGSSGRKYQPGDRWDVATQDWITEEEWNRRQAVLYPSVYGAGVSRLPATKSSTTVLGPPTPGDDTSLPPAVDRVVGDITHSLGKRKRLGGGHPKDFVDLDQDSYLLDELSTEGNIYGDSYLDLYDADGGYVPDSYDEELYEEWLRKNAGGSPATRNMLKDKKGA